jgi:hypothetical protein
MKKVILLAIISTFIFTSCNYEPGVTEAFAKYKFKDGVTTVSVPGWLIGMASKFSDLSRDEREILESIDKIKVLVVDDNSLNARINLHQEFYNRMNRKGDYEELLVVRDNEDNVTVFGKMNEDVIEEMVILVGGSDNMMVYLKGEIKPEMINNAINLKDPDTFVSLNF